MWMHIDSEDYKAARAGVAVADKPTGPFTYIESVRPKARTAATKPCFRTTMARLIASILLRTTTQPTSRCLPTITSSTAASSFACSSGGAWRPGRLQTRRQVLVRRLGLHGLEPQRCTVGGGGLDLGAVEGTGQSLPRPARRRRSADKAPSCSPWPASRSLIFMADRWNKTHLDDSRYLWLPLRFTAKGFEMPWRDAWHLSDSVARRIFILRWKLPSLTTYALKRHPDEAWGYLGKRSIASRMKAACTTMPNPRRCFTCFDS